MREVLRGHLGPFRLPSLLQLLENEMSTGILEVDGAGEVAVRNGQIVRAACGSLSGLQAVYELFFFEDGPFHVRLDPSIQGPPIGSLLGIILEGSRLSDEWQRLAPLYLAPPPGAAAPTVAEPAAAVVRRLDGRRPVADAAAGRPRVVCVDPILSLCESGALVEVAPPGGKASGRAPTPAPAARTAAPAAARAAAPEPGSPPSWPSYDDAMDAGRRFLRDGQLAEAEQAFAFAVSLRTEDRIATQNLRRVRAAREGQSGAFQWFRKT